MAAPAASAGDRSGFGGTDTTATNTGTGAEVGVGSQSVIPASGTNPHRGRGAPTSYCTFAQIDIANPVGNQGAETGPYDQPEGTQLWRSCFDKATGRRISGPTLFTTGAPGAPNQANIQQQLIDAALANLDIDLPVPEFSPPVETIPNVDTWMWTRSPTTLTASASAAGLTITATATLQTTDHLINATPGKVSPDDGVTISCAGTGTVYSVGATSSCTHEFAAPTRDLTIDTTAVWQLAWTATNGNSGSLGTVSRTSTTAYRVQEKRTVIRHAVR